MTVIVDIESFAGSGGNQDTVYAGLVKDELDYVVAYYNNARNRVGLEVTVAGMVNDLGSVSVAADFEGNEQQNDAPVVEPGRALGQSFTASKPFRAVGGHFPPTTPPRRR